MLSNPGSVVATDYSPRVGSPLLDVGGTVAVVTTDYLGTTRPQGAAYDIGAFEGVWASPTPTQVGSTATATPTETPIISDSPTPSITPTPASTPIADIDVLWPNPWDEKGELSIVYKVDEGDGSMSLKLYTVASRKVFEDVRLETTMGQHLYRMTGGQVGHLAAGLYYLVLEWKKDGHISEKVFRLLVLR
jgi:hypothetical protein